MTFAADHTGALGAPALEEQLRPLITGELAAIGAITAALPALEEPAYGILYHSTRMSKQANVEQMLTLLRMAGGAPSSRAGVAETVQVARAAVTQRVSETATLGAFRASEERLLARYRETHAALGGFQRRALERPVARSTKRWHVLTAHFAKREGGAAGAREAARLPRPLAAYFAGPTARVCDRCLLDRPGTRPAIEKDPPRQYVCAACHDEVLAGIPPDLRAQVDRYPPDVYRNRILFFANERPEQLRAEFEVHAVLSGLPPEVPVPAAQRPTAKLVETHDDAKRPAEPGAGRQETAPEAATPSERAYTDALFDPRSVRRSW